MPAAAAHRPAPVRGRAFRISGTGWHSIGRPRSDPAREAALVAAVEAGDTIWRASRTFNVPYSTAKEWYARAVLSGLIRPQEKARMDMMGAILDANLRALLAGAEVMADPEYLAAQNVRDLGVSLGIVSDKSLRLAERLAAREQPERDGGLVDGPAPPGGLPDGPGD